MYLHLQARSLNANESNQGEKEEGDLIKNGYIFTETILNKTDSVLSMHCINCLDM